MYYYNFVYYDITLWTNKLIMIHYPPTVCHNCTINMFHNFINTL